MDNLLGPCCHCEKADPSVRNVVALARRAPMPGTGWGCFQCHLPPDGAIAVLCDKCSEASLPIRFVCVGQPGKGNRLPVEQLGDEVFYHDLSKHPEEAAFLLSASSLPTPPDAQLPTTERLARALEALNDPKLLGMIAQARAGLYDDYKSALNFPMIQLVRDLEAADYPEMAQRARDGEFDATEAEAHAWMQTREACAILDELRNQITKGI